MACSLALPHGTVRTRRGAWAGLWIVAAVRVCSAVRGRHGAGSGLPGRAAHQSPHAVGEDGLRGRYVFALRQAAGCHKHGNAVRQRPDLQGDEAQTGGVERIGEGALQRLHQYREGTGLVIMREMMMPSSTASSTPMPMPETDITRALAAAASPSVLPFCAAA